MHTYPDGQTLPTPKAIDFTPGHLLGSVSGELGLRQYLESQGHTLVVTSSKDGPVSVLEKELADAEVVISQPFWPAYLTAERIAKAPKLKLALTAGIGSDHVDLDAAIKAGITVAEVTFCNSISVAEHVVMMILGLVRNYIPSHDWVSKGGWHIADCVARSYAVEGMHVGTVAAGRIGLAVLKRLKTFSLHLQFTAPPRLATELEAAPGHIGGAAWGERWGRDMYSYSVGVSLNVWPVSELRIGDWSSDVCSSVLASSAITSRPTTGSTRSAGTSPIAWRVPTMSRVCTLARLPPGASASRCSSA